MAAANGEQMLRMSARYADGIMTSDFTPGRLRWAREHIDPVLEETGRDKATFPLINFWATSYQGRPARRPWPRRACI